MTYILTIHNKSLFEDILTKSVKSVKPRITYKQFIYKYDDCIGVYNQNDNTYNVFKIEQIDSNSHFMFEKLNKLNYNSPPTMIDDLYYENITQYEHFKLIGEKDNIIQFEFNDYNKLIYMLQTNYKSLFEKLDLTTLKIYCEKHIDEKHIGEIPFTKTEIIKYKPLESKHFDSKPSKYFVKNKAKYEHKKYSGITLNSKISDGDKKQNKRFDSKISYVTRVE